MWFKAGGAFLAIVILYSIGAYTVDAIGDAREASVRAEIAEERGKAAAAALAARAVIGETLERDTDEIIHAKQEDDGAIAPVLRRQLERMRTR